MFIYYIKPSARAGAGARAGPCGSGSASSDGGGGAGRPRAGPRAKRGGASPVINFYDRGQPYYEFTNFASFPITVERVKFPTSEHYFQAHKFEHRADLFDHVRRARTPREAFDLTRRPAFAPHVRKDWAAAKDGVMLTALRAKFTQHAALTQMLLQTAGSTLVEHTANDAYWGDGGDGSGQNRLGKLLMQVRDELRASQAVP